MPQWDVYVNPAAGARERLPFVVVLQSDLVDGLPTRLVAPLARSQVEPVAVPQRMTPAFEIAGERLLLKVHEAGILPARTLRTPVASLREHAHRIVDALDAVMSGV